MVVTGRMHVAIASLSQIVPVICYSYGDKFTGLLEHFNLEADKLIVSPKSNIRESMSYCLNNNSFILNNINERLKTVIGLSGKNFI